jgi:ATP-dependent DNA ligase
MLKPPVEPMEAKTVAKIPRGTEWLYEPKWDGFRCIAFRDGADIALQSKAGQPLERYFPELVDAVLNLKAPRFVLDGEIFIERDGGLDFDALLQRIHPAPSRIQRLSKETPAAFAVFDILDDGSHEYAQRLLHDRRAALETFAAKQFSKAGSVALSPATRDAAQAQKWLEGGIARFDGVIAKRLDMPYRFGERDAVVKIKRIYTADCVIGGYRLTKDDKTIGSLLLGLYDDEGLLHLVGFVGSMSTAERARAKELLEPITGGSGFTGAKPGGVSRWGSRDTEWHPVKPSLVVEVQFDRVTGSRFRHGAKLVRWRPDKDPRQCTMEQMLTAKTSR